MSRGTGTARDMAAGGTAELQGSIVHEAAAMRTGRRQGATGAEDQQMGRDGSMELTGGAAKRNGGQERVTGGRGQHRKTRDV